MPPRFKDLFDANSQSTREFLSTLSEGLCVPSYQRDYSWDSSNIQRLFGDVLHGIRQLLDRPAAVSFLGTLITIDETNRATIAALDPSGRTRIKTLVDGQQRVCTLVMSNIALHDHIHRASRRFTGRPDVHFRWVSDQCAYILDDIRNTYLIDTAITSWDYRYYPKVIRALSDVWSNAKTEALYESPIARLIWAYMEHCENQNTNRAFRFEPDSPLGSQVDQYKMLRVAFNSIRTQIRNILRSSPDYGFPNLNAATQRANFFNEIWPYRYSEETRAHVADYLAHGSNADFDYKTFCDLLRLIALARYLNDRVAVTVVAATNDDDAFDIFEALNTTGTPLTAFETFKPKVIELEGDGYSSSESRRWIDSVEADLSGFTKADARQSATSDMLVPFALAETGYELQRKLNEQRRYLRDEYDTLKKQQDPDVTRGFVRALARVSSVVRHAWTSDSATPFQPLNVENEHARLALRVLRDLKHSITVAPIARFYQYALDASDESIAIQRTKDLETALQATVAFSALWRGAKRGTAGIDSQYREVLRTGIPERQIPPLARRPRQPGAITVADYKKALAFILQDRGKIGSSEDWCRAIANQPVYESSTKLTRFLLFCALHETVPNANEPGLILEGLTGVPSMLSLRQWRNEKYSTVEHIAPKTKADGWDDAIYADSDLVHTLGNLTLLPSPENSVVGAKSWDDKRLIYKLWSARTQDEFNAFLKTIEANGMSLSERAEGVVAQSGFLAACESLSSFPGPWSVDMIRRRTRCLAELAWKRLAPWLFS